MKKTTLQRAYINIKVTDDKTDIPTLKKENLSFILSLNYLTFAINGLSYSNSCL